MAVRNSRKRILGRMRWTAVILLIVAVFLVGRLFVLQVIDRAELEAKNMNQVQTSRKLQSPRGTIFDRNGRPLAVSSVTKSLYADPKMIKKDPAEIAALIGPYLNINEEEIVKDLQKDTAFVWLDRMMDRDKSDAVQKIINEDGMEGLNFIEESKRFYPSGNLLAQVLGFVGIDDKGLDGLEMVLDEDIRGDVTKVVVDTDRKGNPIFGSVFTKMIPDKEKSVTLTVDTTIQYIAERALDKAVQETKASGASVIIMDPKTGDILAMANQPTYDPNHYDRYSEEAFKNRAVINLYEPGSTFKPIIAAAALATGKWKLDQVFDDPGYVNASGHTIRNWDDEGYGKVKLLDILKYSINTGMAHIGLTVGAHDLLSYIKTFGFGSPTGIELPGEGDGILFDEDTMVAIDTASMSIGQGIAVTPLQMVQAFGALANNGHMMKPHIIKEIKNPDGTIFSQEEPKEVGTPISPEVAKAISDILEKEVSEGGGHKAFVEGYRFAGKTGTAQKLDAEHGGYLKGRYIASFIGFGPVESPAFVALIVIDDPEGTYYGGQIAAPVFKDIMNQLVRFYRFSPSTMTESAANAGGLMQDKMDKAVTRSADGNVIVPDFTGWTMGEVRQWAVKANLKFKPQGSGYAVSQTPRGGSSVDNESSVTVNFTE